MVENCRVYFVKFAHLRFQKEMKATLFCGRGLYKNIYNLAKVK